MFKSLFWQLFGSTFIAIFGNLPILATITHWFDHVNQKLPFLEICHFWQLITHCFPIGDHVNQKLPFLEICQFWQQLHTGFPIRNHVNQKLPFLEICQFWQQLHTGFPIGDAVFGNLQTGFLVAVFGKLPEVEI